MAGFVRKCPCLKPQIEDDVTVLDYRHCSLADVPGEVFNFERTLEELLTDSNQIRDLPRELFYCHGIRKLSISDNEIINIPPAICSLNNLEELNFSKNGVIDVPETIKQCKLLSVIDASVNPLGKLPDGFTQLQNLTQLYLNDTFLDYLPGSFGRLTRLKIFEIRENHLKTLPQSFGRLIDIERLDIGNNEFTELPNCIGSLVKLSELWCDSNQIKKLPESIGNLKELMFLDASKNRIKTIPEEIEGCSSLADLHLTCNKIEELPETLGNLSNLTTFKIDDNHLTSLPKSLGGLTSLSELNVSTNDLEALPPTIGFLRNLRTFYADENLLEILPPELGSCNGLTVLSLRSNKLTYIPDELGRIPKLRVLNLSDNSLKFLPFSVVKLKNLQALWLTENQTKPLISLQSEYDEETGRKILTCYLLPQQPSNYTADENDGDTDSFHPSIWEEERGRRQKIQFEFGEDIDDNEHLVRRPTPYPKDLREKARHARNLALRQTLGDRDYEEGQENYGFEHEGGLKTRDLSPHRGHRDIKPTSPSSSLQETHRLYRYDKEKLIKDKARIQQRHSTEHDDMVLRSPKPKRHLLEGRGHKKGLGDQPSTRAKRPGSNPEIPQSIIDSNSAKTGHNSAEWQFDALNYKQLRYHHKGHKKRMRDYDSDTGYRSDQDIVRFHNQYLHHGNSNNNNNHHNLQSIPQSSSRRRSRDTAGYGSDLESYVSQTRNAAYKHIPLTQQYGAQSVPYDLNSRNSEWRKSDNQSRSSSKNTVQNYEYHSRPYNAYLDVGTKPVHIDVHSGSTDHLQVDPINSRDNLTLNGTNMLPSPSPSLFQRSRFIDQSTPVCVEPSQDDRRSSTSSIEENNNAKDWKRGLYTVLEENMARAASNQKLNYTSQSIEGATSIPPPYQPAPPYYKQPHTPTGDRRHLQSPKTTDSPRATSVERSPSNVDTPFRRDLDSCLQKRLSDPSINLMTHQFSEMGSPSIRRTNRSGSCEMLDQDNDRAHTLPTNIYNNGVMNRYEDVAMYKSDPPSQVSSSTDSGYGHSHQTFDRANEFFHKYSGLNTSQQSPSPHSHTTISRNSSSSREYITSREATPVDPSDTIVNKIEYVDNASQESKDVFQVQISKNPGLGFSITGGIDSKGNPFQPHDKKGIFITKVQSDGPAKHCLRRGDKILKMNGTDFTSIEHNKAVTLLKTTHTACLLVERIQKINLV